MGEQGTLDPERLVFIDETYASTGMVLLRGRSQRGECLVDHAPHGHWKTFTVEIQQARLEHHVWRFPRAPKIDLAGR